MKVAKHNDASVDQSIVERRRDLARKIADRAVAKGTHRLSPLQYQKRLRLHVARERMLNEGLTHDGGAEGRSEKNVAHGIALRIVPQGRHRVAVVIAHGKIGCAVSAGAAQKLGDLVDQASAVLLHEDGVRALHDPPENSGQKNRQADQPFPLLQLPYHRLVNPWTLGAVMYEASHNLQSDLGLSKEIPRQVGLRLLKADMGRQVASVWVRCSPI